MAPAQDFQSFLGSRAVAVLGVCDRGNRAVGVLHRNCDILLEKCFTDSRTCGEHSNRSSADDPVGQVDEMTNLAEQTASLTPVLVPMRVRESACTHTVVGD